MKKYAIIVAGGSGSRMQSEIPKQFLILKNKPILLHTIEKFTAIGDIKIFVVLPKNQISYWINLCSEYQVPEHEIVTGGETRFHSSQNGIKALSGEEEGLVAIHDGVRPLVSTEVILKAYELAEKKGSAVLAIDSKDSIRKWNPESDEFEAVDRNLIKIIQTPQIFHQTLLEKAFELPYKAKFTDDASVVEELGAPIFLSEGNVQNIKITTQEDLKLAEIILNQI